MKLGSAISFFGSFGKDRYKKMKEHGFDYADYDIGVALDGKADEECEPIVLAEKALADEAGVTIWQVHGPWRYPPHDETPELRHERELLMQNSIRLTAMIGCKNWVIHPLFPFGDCGFDMDSFWKINEEFFKRLASYAEQYGVIICFENMPMKQVNMSSTEKTLEFIRRINSDNFKLCLDTGHELSLGLSPAEAVRLAGKDLQVLHVHDNDGNRDRHLIPGMGVADWMDFYKALNEVGFDGVFSLEAGFNGFLPGMPMDTKIKALKVVLADIMKD